METNSKITAAILGVLLAAGLAGAGYFVSTTVYKGRLASNAVTVKGSAEQDVKADLALWQISYSVTGQNLADVYARSQANEKVLTDLLNQKGFAAAEVKAGAGLHLTDALANEYRARDAADADRYILNNNITVRSTNVELVDRTTHELNDVIRQGIVLTSNSVDYQFTKLNDIKAAMLKAATQNARDLAQQFANDANSAVGSIQSANQGFFSIVSRDAADQGASSDGGYSGPPASTIDKKVRVVVSLTYYLER